MLVPVLWVALLPGLVASTIRSRTGFAVQVDRLAVNPFTGTVLGLVTNTIGGMFKDKPDLLKELAGPLQDAGRMTGEKLKGLLDSLDKRRP